MDATSILRQLNNTWRREISKDDSLNCKQTLCVTRLGQDAYGGKGDLLWSETAAAKVARVLCANSIIHADTRTIFEDTGKQREHSKKRDTHAGTQFAVALSLPRSAVLY